MSGVSLGGKKGRRNAVNAVRGTGMIFGEMVTIVGTWTLVGDA
jgi:hypothetical protein